MRKRHRSRATLALKVAERVVCASLIMSVWACSPSSQQVSPERPKTSHHKTLRVFAASSLSDVMRRFEERFERAHPTIDVKLNLAGTQTLSHQLRQGARADLFFSADHSHLLSLASDKVSTAPVLFAHNELVIIVSDLVQPPLESVGELTRLSRLVVGTPDVPIGRYTNLWLERLEGVMGQAFVAQVRSRVVSMERNVRLVRAKVELGEAEAAIVYQSDLVGARGVSALPLPEELRMTTSLAFAKLLATQAPKESELFLAYVRSQEGSLALKEAGFSPLEPLGAPSELQQTSKQTSKPSGHE